MFFGHVRYHLFQLLLTKEELLIALDIEAKKLKDFDPCDILVIFGALEHDCNMLITSNLDDFPKTFGNIDVVRPGAYYEYLTNKIQYPSENH